MVNQVVEATTVGFMPSSNNNGLMTIPPPIPSIPARVPAMIEHPEICMAEPIEILYSVGWNEYPNLSFWASSLLARSIRILMKTAQMQNIKMLRDQYPVPQYLMPIIEGNFVEPFRLAAMIITTRRMKNSASFPHGT